MCESVALLMCLCLLLLLPLQTAPSRLSCTPQNSTRQPVSSPSLHRCQPKSPGKNAGSRPLTWLFVRLTGLWASRAVAALPHAQLQWHRC
jgi:hypothetical protein